MCKTMWNNANWYPNQQLVSFFVLVIAGEKLTCTLSCIRDTKMAFFSKCPKQATINYISKPLFYAITPCLMWANSKNVKNMYPHIPFITIIEVIKVEHLWAKCNIALADFFLWNTVPLALSILVSRLCVTLIPTTPIPLPWSGMQFYPQC